MTTAEKHAAPVCRCVKCSTCAGYGHYAVNIGGQYVGPGRCDDTDDYEHCEECGGSGISDGCDNCQQERWDSIDEY